MTEIYRVLLFDMPNRGGFGGFIIIAIIAIFFLTRESTIKKLKKEYDDALRSSDKQRALAAGRKYYAKLRSDGLLTQYDEQAIANDINAMQ